jgi:hypothetical protein
MFGMDKPIPFGNGSVRMAGSHIDAVTLLNRNYLSRPEITTLSTGIQPAEYLKMTSEELRKALVRGVSDKMSIAFDTVERAMHAVQHFKKLRQSGRRRAIVFVQTIQAAVMYADAFRNEGIWAEAVVQGDKGILTGREQHPKLTEWRRSLGIPNHLWNNDLAINAYLHPLRQGPEVLVTAKLLTEGVDLPPTDCVYVARVTNSSVLYTQMVGRGLRGPLTESKIKCQHLGTFTAKGTPTCTIVDIHDQWGEHENAVLGNHDAARRGFLAEYVGEETTGQPEKGAKSTELRDSSPAAGSSDPANISLKEILDSFERPPGLAVEDLRSKLMGAWELYMLDDDGIQPDFPNRRVVVFGVSPERGQKNLYQWLRDRASDSDAPDVSSADERLDWCATVVANLLQQPHEQGDYYEYHFGPLRPSFENLRDFVAASRFGRVEWVDLSSTLSVEPHPPTPPPPILFDEVKFRRDWESARWTGGWSSIREHLVKLAKEGRASNISVRSDEKRRGVVWARRVGGEVAPILHFWGTGDVWLYLKHSEFFGSRGGEEIWSAGDGIDFKLLESVLWQADRPRTTTGTASSTC